MKRVAAVLAPMLLILIAWGARYDGGVEAVNPDVAVIIQGSSGWWARPTVLGHRTDVDGVYVLAPEMPVADKFAAVRVSASTGEQSLRNIDISPESGFKDCLPDDAVRAAVHGLRFSRLSFHLFLFPSGAGPGFHHTDSATGTIEIVLQDARGTRPLIRERAFNSDRIVELLAETCADRGGHWVAVPMREQAGSWKLFVFRR